MKIFTKTLVAAVASAFVVSGAGMAATPILAQEAGQQDPAAAAAAATVNADKTGTLHIHKKSGDTSEVRNDGLPKDNVPGNDLAGAVYKVERVTNIDLTKAEGWIAAEKLAKGAEGAVTPTFEEAGTAKTGANGAADFANLPLGLYRVTETAAPSGHAKADPFYVTLPMTNPQNRDAWMYEVHIYPKNQKQDRELTKTVKDANKNAGEKIDYQITTGLPSYDKLARFQIVDLYDADRLEADADSVTSVTAGGTEFAKGTDYNVVPKEAGKLYVIFTEAGRAKLDALQGDARKVQVNLSMTVKEIAGDETGSVTNTFTVIENPDSDPDKPDNPDEPGNPPENPPTPTEEPKSYFGNVKILKNDTAEKALEGAVFDVYRCDEATGNDKQKDKLEGAPVRTGLTTNAQGEARANGLHVNDFVDGTAQASKPSGYCLVETKAPHGHELQTDVTYFQVLKGGGDTVALTSLKVTDVQHNGGFQLPLTGGNGIWMILAAGGLLVIMGGGYYYISRRENA